MKWTEKQAEAITLRKKNILVAAAAGSGKTAVLVERVRQLIVDEKVDVTELLVVTFTNAAAAEMREKIVKAVNLEIEKNSGDTAFLRHQLNTIYKANICTFHAFALEVIRRFFYIIGIDPNFKICDEAQQIILQSQAMENLFEESFDSEKEGFVEFLNCYASGKNENAVKEMILEVYKTIQSVPEPWDWLEKSIENLSLKKDAFLKSKTFQDIRAYIKSKLYEARENYRESVEIFQDAGAVKFAGKCRGDLELIDKALQTFDKEEFTLDDFDETAQRLECISYARMVTVKEEKEVFDEVKEYAAIYRERCKSTIKDIKEQYFMRPLAEQVEDMNRVYPKAAVLGELVKGFSEHYRKEKEEKKLIDFNDIEHYALEILKNQQAASEYREKFKYIFIDEYQDSNVIQDTLIGAIKRENNLFMVGDVKQSIYKFRLAEPELFMEKYELFKRKENQRDAKIDLNFNFRSKGSVIKAVNDIFSKLMNSYDEDAALYKGVEYEGELDYPVELHLVNRKITEDMEVEDEIRELKGAETEALIAGKLIKEALGKPVFDVKNNRERPLAKKDIVILMRGQKNYADKFQQILMEMDIPSHINDSDGYFDTLEIQIFLNLLRIINNRRQDIPLLSVLHSALFGFTVSELAEIRSAFKEKSYFDAFCMYAEQNQNHVAVEEHSVGHDAEHVEGHDAGYDAKHDAEHDAGHDTEHDKIKDKKLSKKCRDALELMEEWKHMAIFMPLDEFLWKLMKDTGYYTFTGALPGGQQRQANLRALIDKAVQFQASQMKGLYGFITYVEAVKDRKVPMGQVTLVGENDDVVRIMTIHKSKGLEFPMVIVAGMGKGFNKANSRKPVDIHKNIGIGLRYVNREEHYYRKTLLQMAIDNKRKQEDIEEEIRILYVAFTRAQDKLILLGTVRDLEKYLKDRENIEIPHISGASGYLDMVVPVVRGSSISIHCHDAQELSFDNVKEAADKEALKSIMTDLNATEEQAREGRDDSLAQLYCQIDKQLSFKYGYEYARLLKSKFSVSRLNKISDLLAEEGMTPEKYEKLYYETSYDSALAVPEFSKTERKGFTAAERGSIIHSVLEHWDFKKGGLICNQEKDKALEYICSFITELQKKQLLTEEQGTEALKNQELIYEFQCSPLGKRLAEAEEVFKEVTFNLMKKIKDEDIIVQGIIDCYFQEKGEYVLLDYKTNRINNPQDEQETEYIKETYREQINLYRQAIEEVKGVRVKEAYLCLLNGGIILKMDR